MKRQEWNGFQKGLWEDEIDVRNFIQKNYTPYGGDGSFLCGPTQRTLDVRKKFEDLLRQEHQNGGALKVDTETVIDLQAGSARQFFRFQSPGHSSPELQCRPQAE